MRILPLCLLLPLPAAAETISVVTDIPPVQSLVAQVTDGVGMPEVIVGGGSSPHSLTLRPSQAAALQGADVIFWVGEELTPWLSDPIATLPTDAVTIALLSSPGWDPLPQRDLALFEDSDEHDHDHEASGFDAHAWLDPNVAATWVQTIAMTLSAIDPEHSDLYQHNAETAAKDLSDLAAEITEQLNGFRDQPYLTPHDSLQYFERAFSLPAAGALGLHDDTPPAASHIRALQELVATEDITCLLLEPQTDTDWTDILGDTLNTAEIDIVGQTLEQGPGLYPKLLRTLADSLEECLSPTQP